MSFSTHSKLSIAILILATCLFARDGGAVADSFRPASFAGGVGALEGIIKLPEFGGEHTMSVTCYAIVTPVGKISSQHCYTPPGNGIIGDAIYNLGDKITLIPALKNGKPITVWMPFAVTFIQNSGQRSLRIYSYHRQGDAAFEPANTDYSAPQWVPRKHDWSTGCRSRNIVAWLTMTVTERGIPRQVKKLEKIHPGFCAFPIIRYVTNGSFIPAFENGVPVASQHQQAFYSLLHQKNGIKSEDVAYFSIRSRIKGRQ